jgi:hypothetical protein
MVDHYMDLSADPDLLSRQHINREDEEARTSPRGGEDSTTMV